MKLLVVEDEQRIAQAIKDGLENESYLVDVANDGPSGFSMAKATDYDLIIMDIMLPGMSGIEVCTKLREAEVQTPILILTAKDHDQDVILGLDGGADDYLAKPFSFEVLLARIRALLRRPQQTADDILVIQDVELNLRTRQVTRAGVDVRLSNKEYSLLEYLVRNKGKVLSKNAIMAHVWDFDADILPNTVEVFMTYLRAKIDKPFDGPPIIHTVRGFGYKAE